MDVEGARHISGQDAARENGKFEKKGFCVYISKGKTGRSESHVSKDFCNVLDGKTVAWVDFVVDDLKKEAPEKARDFGFSHTLVESLLKEQKSGYEDLETEMGLMLPTIHVRGFEVLIDPLLILIRNGILITLHSKEARRFFRLRRYAETFMNKLSESMPMEDKTTTLLIRIIDENNNRNFDHLQEIEEHGDELSKLLTDPKTPRNTISTDIYKMKHALIMYLGGLWATVDTLNTLRYGDANLITNNPNLIRRIGALNGEVHGQIGLAEHMSEVLASGLEVLQSIYNNQLQILNNRLALLVSYLTIIGTALLVPNTIATVASNSAFNLTANDVPWYLGLIIFSTLAATLLSWWIVKKMRLLPKSPE